MKFVANNKGFAVQGTLDLVSKSKLFKVNGKFETEYEVSGDLDRKVNGDTFDRYITIAMREMAIKWLKYEDKVTAPLAKLLDSEEQAIEKLGKTIDQAALQIEQEKRQKSLEAEADKLIKTVLSPALIAAAAESHTVAFNTLSKEAKSVLTTKKSIAFKIAGVTFKVGFGVTGTVLAGLAVGSVAGGPIGAAIGATAAVVMALVAVVTKGVAILISLTKQAKSVHAEFGSNFKAYNAAVAKLNSQMDDTHKLSRGLTAKWDTLCLKQAEILTELEKLSDPLSKIGKGDAKAAKLADLRDKLETEGRAMGKFVAYDPKKVENAFQTMRSLLQQDCVPDVFEKGLEKVGGHFDRVENLVGAAGTVISGIANG